MCSLNYLPVSVRAEDRFGFKDIKFRCVACYSLWRGLVKCQIITQIEYYSTHLIVVNHADCHGPKAHQEDHILYRVHQIVIAAKPNILTKKKMLTAMCINVAATMSPRFSVNQQAIIEKEKAPT
jgi:hypothetical protein